MLVATNYAKNVASTIYQSPMEGFFARKDEGMKVLNEPCRKHYSENEINVEVHFSWQNKVNNRERVLAPF